MKPHPSQYYRSWLSYIFWQLLGITLTFLREPLIQYRISQARRSLEK